jgi:hypothetical protein
MERRGRAIEADIGDEFTPGGECIQRLGVRNLMDEAPFL